MLSSAFSPFTSADCLNDVMGTNANKPSVGYEPLASSKSVAFRDGAW